MVSIGQTPGCVICLPCPKGQEDVQRFTWMISVQVDKMLDLSKLKAFADKKLGTGHTKSKLGKEEKCW